MKNDVPLAALRVFDLAARYLSFTRTADDLFVTQAAVSHQIRRLEDYLGVKLFKRLNRALMLTDEGQLLVPPLRDALEQIDSALAKVTSSASELKLTVSMLPSVASRWLVPRLGSFIARYPEIDLLLAPSTKLTDFDRDNVDVVIRYGRGEYAGLISRWMMDEDRFPVCAPELQRSGDIHVPSDLSGQTLLHDDSRTEWAMWLRLAGVEEVNAERGPVFSDASLMLEAAASGQGVALARSRLADLELASGRLVRLFETTLPTDQAYYLVYPPAHAERPAVKAFCDWALDLPMPG